MTNLIVPEEGPLEPASSVWDVMMALFNYPLPAFMRNVKFITIDQPNIPRAAPHFPYRAILKTPVYHPELPTYRLCPNFPSVCVDDKGHVEIVTRPGAGGLDRLTIQFTGLGDYIYIPVPGRGQPQFVSRFMLFCDAWAPMADNPQSRYEFAPKDRKYTNLTPENVHRVTPWKKGKQRLYEKNEDRDSISIARGRGLSLKPLSKAMLEALDKSTYDFMKGNWWLEDCAYVGLQVMSKNKYANSIDWCFNKYWAIAAMTNDPKHLHPTVYVGTSWRDLEVKSGLPPKLAKLLLKKSKPTDEVSVFLL